MIKSWWAEKSTSEKQIVAALAVLSLGVFCWLAVIKPIDTYIEEHQSHAQKIKKDIKWMQDQASTHGLLGHPALTQPIKNILLEEAKRENLTITLENGRDNYSQLSRWCNLHKRRHTCRISVSYGRFSTWRA